MFASLCFEGVNVVYGFLVCHTAEIPRWTFLPLGSSGRQNANAREVWWSVLLTDAEVKLRCLSHSQLAPWPECNTRAQSCLV